MRRLPVPPRAVLLAAVVCACASPGAAQHPDGAPGAALPHGSAVVTPAEPPGAPLAPAPPHVAAGPTLAREDTMHVSLPAVLVTAPRLTLDEILDRISRAERRRDSLLVDESFVATIRIMRARDETSPPRLLEESVVQVFRKKPGHARTLLIRHRRDRDQKGWAEVQFNFRADMSEEIVNFAFRPDSRREYRYHIVGRDLVGDQLIYRIHFEPRSPLDPTRPSGTVWVNTNDFVIVRQEVSFDRSPVPLIIKGIDRMVLERERVGDFWVLHRALLRARFTFPMPRLGRRLDFGMQFDQYALNSGLPDSLFTAGRAQ